MKNLVIPVSILCGAAMIAAAVFFKDSGTGVPAVTGAPVAQRAAAPTPTVISDAKAARESDRHIYGNIDAAITIVEFSDYECPFCARLHPTLKRIVDESNGGINWEYRHLPLPNHQNARPAAIASECVAKLAGPEAFWQFSDVLFANIGGANATFLQAEAVKLGVAPAAYEACRTDAAIAARVDADSAAAARLGGRGTPFSLIVDNSTDTARPVSGAVPYEQWQAALSAI